MIYLSTVCLSEQTVTNPNIYPYCVFRGKYIEPFVFEPITLFYGSNGSGKSTLLNVIANKLKLKGREYITANALGRVDYCGKFSEECSFGLRENEYGKIYQTLPENSRYIKSEDIP